MKTPSKWVEGIEPDTPAIDAAESVLRSRLKATLALVAGATEEAVKDPEFTHQLRVSTRRATAAVNAFEPWLDVLAAKKSKKRLRHVRRVAGEARDWDIFVSALGQKAESAEVQQRGGIEFLL